MRKSSRLNHSAPSPAAQNGAPGGKAIQSPRLGDQPRSPASQERAVDAQPPTQVVVTPRRRSFTAQYKLQVLEELDACRAPCCQPRHSADFCRELDRQRGPRRAAGKFPTCRDDGSADNLSRSRLSGEPCALADRTPDANHRVGSNPAVQRPPDPTDRRG